jgi:hypothetical protein
VIESASITSARKQRGSIALPLPAWYASSFPLRLRLSILACPSGESTERPPFWALATPYSEGLQAAIALRRSLNGRRARSATRRSFRRLDLADDRRGQIGPLVPGDPANSLRPANTSDRLQRVFAIPRFPRPIGSSPLRKGTNANLYADDVTRRTISQLIRSSGLVECSFGQCACGKR